MTAAAILGVAVALVFVANAVARTRRILVEEIFELRQRVGRLEGAADGLRDLSQRVARLERRPTQ